MDSNFISLEGPSSDEQRYSDGINTVAESSNQNMKSNNADRPSKTPKSSCLHPATIRIIGALTFKIVAMVVGILIVCFTTPKPINTCEMTFRRTMKSSIISSSQPYSIAIGDLNNDNQMDIVTANSGTHTIGIFISNKNGGFAIQQTYLTGLGARPSSVTLNDFNNDNYLDIAVANYGTNNMGIFFGYGNGTYNTQKMFSTGAFRPWFISSGDFNKDNHSDIAIVYYGTDNIGILLGNGDGSFHNQIIYSTGYDSRPNSLVIGDFNKDNQLDIAVANYGTDNIGIFLGYSNGTFATQKIYSTNRYSNPSSVAIGDFNNDKQLDIVVTNYGIGNIGIFLGDGNGTFRVQTTYEISSSSRPQFITTGYFNKDNYLDVVVVDSDNDQVHIIPGYGNGSFATLTTYDSITGSHPCLVGVADFDKDNQSDIAVVNYGINNVFILSGYSSIPSVRQTKYFIGRDSRPFSVVIYDFNNDGQLDIAVDNVNDNNILILFGTDDGSFVRGKSYSTGIDSNPVYLCIGDLNNDNRMDIVTANLGASNIGILLGENNGTFANVITYSTGISSTPWCVALGDLNNDTYLDIVSANKGTHTIGVFLGYGNGSFTEMTTYSASVDSSPAAIRIGDVNNDNHLDMVLLSEYSDFVSVFLGYGNGSFRLITNYSNNAAADYFMLVLADLNRDNNLDTVLSNRNTGSIYVFLGNGDGTFKSGVAYSTGSGTQPYDIFVTDFNKDSYYDMVVTNLGTNEVVIWFGNGNDSFELGRTYSIDFASSPLGVAVADLNNDGDLEIIVTYWGTGYVTILTQYYAAEFANQTIHPTGSAPHPYSLAIADFNNDNRSDVVVANSDTDNLGILLGLNNATFTVQMMYPIGTDSYPQYVITVDFNQDNHSDIVVVNSKSNTMSVIMGYGNGTFAYQMMYTTGDDSHPYSVAMGDFNNDHRYDFVVANEGMDSIGIILGFNYASFQSQQTYSVDNNLQPYTVVTADFNNDNYLDIAVVFQNTNNLVILLGNGDGTFTRTITYSTGFNSLPHVLVINDFNNDRQLDIVVANSGSDNIGIFLGYGNGSFATMMTYSTGTGSTPNSVAVGDFNNDNQTDIVSANYNSNSIGILLGDGSGSFVLTGTFSTGDFSQPNSAAVGDLNNDGCLDITVVNYGTHTLGIFLGYGNGSFQTQMTYLTGPQSAPFWVIVSDFNSDNQSDIAVANYNNQYVNIYLGYGNGSVAEMVRYVSGVGSGPTCVSVGDFNNDNIIDIAVVNNAINTIVVLFGFGDGTFLLGTAYSTGTGSIPLTLAVGDFNNDAQLDIVVANYQSNTIGIFLGYGREPFAGVINYATGDGSQPHSVAVGDFNNDGWSDIVIANYGTDTIGILLGEGNALFGTMITYSTGVGSAPYSVAIGDFNNDSWLDIVVSNSETNNIAILLGYNNGTFAMVGMYSTGARSRPYAVTIGDFNNDKKSDLAIANSGTSNIFLLYGYGNGTFGDETSYPLGYGFLPYSVTVTDLNGDNWMDIVIACYGTDNIETLVKLC